MPGYLDNNIYTGAGNAASQMGDAFTRAIVGTQALRYQQAQLQQQQAMEAARLELERQKLAAEVPKLESETTYNKSFADLNKQKMEQGQTQQDLGKLVADALRARQLVQNPGAGGTLQITPELAKALGSDNQFSQADMLNRLAGIIGGAGGQISLQNPASAVSNLAGAMYMQQSPEALQRMAVGFPPNQGRTFASPEQSAALEVLLEGMRLAGHPTTTTRPSDLGPVRTEEVDAGRALNLGQLGLQQIFPGSTNRFQFATEEPAPTPTPAQQGGFVVVTNPKGQKVRIRAEQLQEALQQGYKQ